MSESIFLPAARQKNREFLITPSISGSPVGRLKKTSMQLPVRSKVSETTGGRQLGSWLTVCSVVKRGSRGLSVMPCAATRRPFFQSFGSTSVRLVAGLSRSLSSPLPPVPGTVDGPLPPALPDSPGAFSLASVFGRSVDAMPPPSGALGGWLTGGGGAGLGSTGTVGVGCFTGSGAGGGGTGFGSTGGCTFGSRGASMGGLGSASGFGVTGTVGVGGAGCGGSFTGVVVVGGTGGAGFGVASATTAGGCSGGFGASSGFGSSGGFGAGGALATRVASGATGAPAVVAVVVFDCAFGAPPPPPPPLPSVPRP